MFISTKTFTHEIGLSCAFRQWRAESHCRFLHGYALKIRVEFGADELDVRNWVVDFGSLKSFKQMLVDQFDHKLVVAEDDPLLRHFRNLELLGGCELAIVPATGCERFAEYVAGAADTWLHANGYSDRVWIHKVEVSEHGANSAVWVNDDKEVDRIAGKIAAIMKEARNG